MNMREEFERMMREQYEIALATMTDGLPHVRIVNFYYASKEHRVYFATLKDNEKVVELAANPNIAVGDDLILHEITLTEAVVNLDFGKRETIVL